MSIAPKSLRSARSARRSPPSGSGLGIWLSALYGGGMALLLLSLQRGNPWLSILVLIGLLPASIPMAIVADGYAGLTQGLNGPQPDLSSGFFFITIALNMLVLYQVGRVIEWVGQRGRRS